MTIDFFHPSSSLLLRKSENLFIKKSQSEIFCLLCSCKLCIKYALFCIHLKSLPGTVSIICFLYVPFDVLFHSRIFLLWFTPSSALMLITAACYSLTYRNPAILHVSVLGVVARLIGHL